MGILLPHFYFMKIFHISDLGKLKYAHVTIDTFSGLLVATALTGKTSKNVIQHFLFFF